MPRALALVLIVALLCSPAAPRTYARPVLVVAANQTLNWAGYDQGVLSKGITFHEVSAAWAVPTVTQHRAGEAEFSSAWIGIGGGCLDNACTMSDATLIQAGTAHEVDAAGGSTYYAWWETIPGPAVRTDLTVRAGDVVRVRIAEGLPQVWTVTIANATAGASFALTLPYTSTYATAEWIVETPVVVQDDGTIGIGPLPDLTPIRFDRATANGVAPRFVAAEQLELVDLSLNVLARPSDPDGERDGFAVCVYAKHCHSPKH